MNGAHLPLPTADARDGAAGLETFTETPAETSAEAASPAATSCRNCDRLFDAHRIAPRFCPQCGQPAVVQPPPIGEAVREWVAENLSPQGTLGRTLALLVLRPGRLTALHVRGRRTRYLPPMKLYLGASFLFFLVLKFIASGPDVPVLVGHINVGMHRATPAAGAPAGTVLFTSGGTSPKLVVTLESARVTRDPAMARAMEARANRCLLAGRDDCGWLERMTTRAAQRWSADPGPAQMAFVRHALNVAPDEVFLMLPVYAAIVALVYRDRRQRFGDHLVFGLHLHAFWFFAAALALVLPRAGVEAVVVFVTWHALVSLHEVYGGSWPRAGLRGIGISVAYLGVFALVTGAASFCLFVS